MASYEKLLEVDFQNIYTLVKSSNDHKDKTIQLIMFSLSVPYFLFAALLGAHAIKSIDGVLSYPGIVYYSFIVAAFFSIVFTMRYVELSKDHNRLLRGVNYFRHIYFCGIVPQLSDWPCDLLPHTWEESKKTRFRWAIVFVAIITIVNSAYITIGVFVPHLNRRFKCDDVYEIAFLLSVLVAQAILYRYLWHNCHFRQSNSSML